MNEKQQDERDVLAFAEKMATRLEEKRAQGYSGWRGAATDGIVSSNLVYGMMRAALLGNFVNVANYAMMLEYHGLDRKWYSNAARRAAAHWLKTQGLTPEQEGELNRRYQEAMKPLMERPPEQGDSGLPCVNPNTCDCCTMTATIACAASSEDDHDGSTPD